MERKRKRSWLLLFQKLGFGLGFCPSPSAVASCRATPTTAQTHLQPPFLSPHSCPAQADPFPVASKVAVVGATGRVGSLVTQSLRARGIQVLAIARNASKMSMELPEDVETFVFDITEGLQCGEAAAGGDDARTGGLPGDGEACGSREICF